MLFSTSDSVIDFSKLEHIPEYDKSFPAACYRCDLYVRDDPWHWHDIFEGAVIESGEAVFYIENKKYILKPGDAYFIKPGILHSISNHNGKHCVVKTIVYGKEIVGETPDSVFWKKYIVPLEERRDFHGFILKKNSPLQRDIIFSLCKIFDLFEFEPDDFEIEARYLLSKISAIAIKNLPSENKFSEKASQNSISKIKVMLLYIWQNYQKPITLSDIASAGATGKNDCLLCFSETVGTSPIQYLKNYRLEKAAELLSSTKLKVSEIAELCGFSDKSYFSKSFYQKFGKKPLEYRGNSKK